jgi:hypothetical protein
MAPTSEAAFEKAFEAFFVAYSDGNGFDALL